MMERLSSIDLSLEDEDEDCGFEASGRRRFIVQYFGTAFGFPQANHAVRLASWGLNIAPVKESKDQSPTTTHLFCMWCSAFMQRFKFEGKRGQGRAQDQKSMSSDTFSVFSLSMLLHP